jgi:excisionase family DNA binding protein
MQSQLSRKSQELLEFYLGLPKKQRDRLFVETARAAEIAGLSQRTIQLWIENGVVQAVSIGKKYKVSLDSLKKHLQSEAAKHIA